MKLEKDHVIWITGASSGIGEALALQLAPRARLILSGRSRGRLEALRGRCAAVAGTAGIPAEDTVRLLPFDLSDRTAVEAAAGAARALFGRIDVLVLNAGVSQRAAFEDTGLETMDRLLEVNYRAPIALVKGCLPHMRERGSGWIVAVSSLAGKVGSPLRTGYCAAKHALLGFCNALRGELRPHGIGVTVVVPGFIRTDISRNALTGRGESYGELDPNQAAGISPRRCAAGIIRAVERGRAEAKTGFNLKAWLALAVSHTSIGLYTRLITRARVT